MIKKPPAMNVPNLTKGRIVPSTLQAWGETFHREQNLDEWFGALVGAVEAGRKLDESLHEYLQGNDRNKAAKLSAAIDGFRAKLKPTGL